MAKKSNETTLRPYVVVAIWHRPQGGFCGFCRRLDLAGRAEDLESELAAAWRAPYVHLYAKDSESRPRRAVRAF